MTRQPLVLLIPSDRLTGLLTKNGLEGYGYDVLTASGVDEARELLRTNSRISILVVDVKLEAISAGLALARDARNANSAIKVIYTCGNPYRLSEREKVRGAPCLRTPYHPHQLVSV